MRPQRIERESTNDRITGTGDRKIIQHPATDILERKKRKNVREATVKEILRFVSEFIKNAKSQNPNISKAE